MKEFLRWSAAEVPDVDCPEVAAQQRSLSAKALSVVFVSDYLNNPASAFGHTMLYLGSDTRENATLVDYSVSFEADTDGMSPREYLPRGLFGGLVAGFRVEPLHWRVRRYERIEQRDLWLLPLQVNQSEIDQLVRHLWELKDVTFRYGFFAGNCAQKILALMHAVAPEYQVLPFHRKTVLPAEAARHLVQKIGLAGEPVRRPSLWSQYSLQVATLSPLDKEHLKSMVTFRTVVDGASPATLRAALLWSEFGTPYRAFRRAVETEDHGDLLWRRRLWTSLAMRDDTSVRAPTQPAGPSVLDGHRPSRITLRGGYRSGSGSMLSANARWLLHEAVDPDPGYSAVSSLEVARVDVGVSGAGAILLDEFTAIRMERLAPVSGLHSALAWKIDIGARRLGHDGESPLHIGAEVGVGAGAARTSGSSSFALYSMVGVRPGLALASGGNTFLPAGILSGGLLLRLPAGCRTRVSAEYSLSLASFKGGTAVLNAVARKALTRNLDLELSSSLGAERSGMTLGFVSFR